MPEALFAPQLTAVAEETPPPAELERARTETAQLISRVSASALNDDEVKTLAEGLRGLSRARDRGAAQLLLEALDRPQLGLYREDGMSLRTLATEALVDMGHPFALEVPPEALEEAAQDRADRERRRTFPWTGLGLFGLGAAAQVGFQVALASDSDADSVLLLWGVITLLVGAPLLGLALNRKTPLARALGIGLVAALGAINLWAGLSTTTLLGGARYGVAGLLFLASAPLFRKRTLAPNAD